MRNFRVPFRRWRAAWRDTTLLLRDFRLPLVLFIVMIGGGGVLYYWLAQTTSDALASPVQAIYYTLGMVFLQANGGFPQTWYLQIFYFVIPIFGIAILAQGLTDFGVLFFNRKARSKEWEIAVASMMNNHTVLVGLGHLGFRVVEQLHAMQQDVVVIELEPRDDLIADLRQLDVPIIQGDATREAVLQSARINQARVLVLCTQDDNLNMQIAVKARSLNPNIRVVMRIFDDDFARALEKQFGFHALSATGMAAPVFAANAAGIDISQPITIEGESLSLARFDIAPKSKLVNLTVNMIEQNYHVSVVLLRHSQGRDLHPAGGKHLAVGDTLAVLGGAEQIHRLVQENR